jgi:hypothetical protein
MWDQLTPADIERVKQRLATERIETLTRHAEELKALDADQAEIETFDRLVAAFAKKHLPPPTTTSEEPTVEVEVGAPASSEVRRNVPAPIQIVHPPSPNFGVPLRRFVRG